MNTACGQKKKCSCCNRSSFTTQRLTPHKISIIHKDWTQTVIQRGPSHGHRSVRVFWSIVYDVLELSGVGDVVARLVLSQDLHQRTQLQPPLLLGDPVTAHRWRNVSVSVYFGISFSSWTPEFSSGLISLCASELLWYIHKVSLILELDHRLEDQSPAAHSQQTAGVLGVSKHSACTQTLNQRCKHRKSLILQTCIRVELKPLETQTYNSVPAVGLCSAVILELFDR